MMISERRRELVDRFKAHAGADPAHVQVRMDVLIELAALWRRACKTCLGSRTVARADGQISCDACGGTGEARP